MKRCDSCGGLKGENEFTVCGECSGCFSDKTETTDTSHQGEVERIPAEEYPCAKCAQLMESLKISDKR
jgi:hypothetical protein